MYAHFAFWRGGSGDFDLSDTGREDVFGKARGRDRERERKGEREREEFGGGDEEAWI